MQEGEGKCFYCNSYVFQNETEVAEESKKLLSSGLPRGNASRPKKLDDLFSNNDFENWSKSLGQSI